MGLSPVTAGLTAAGAVGTVTCGGGGRGPLLGHLDARLVDGVADEDLLSARDALQVRLLLVEQVGDAHLQDTGAAALFGQQDSG